MSRTWYWVIGGVVVVLCIVGLITYSSGKENERAQQKAQELTQKLESAGLRAPDQDIIVRSLGDDGGAVCDNAEDGLKGLSKAILLDLFVNGADFVGRRPVTVDRRVVRGLLLIVDTYCPDEFEQFRAEIDDLEFDDVIKD